MNVLYDGIIYTRQVTGGINRYFARIIEKLPMSVRPVLTYRDRRGITFPDRPGLDLRDIEGTRSYSALSYDLLHPTYYHLLTGEDMNRLRGPVVLTVHDMLHEIYPHLADPGGEQREMKKHTIPHADALICVSENTKRDTMELFNIPEKRITVIHHAAELDRTWADESAPLPPGPYFLYVGHRYCYKNVPRLMEVFARFLGKRDAFLCFAGTPFNDGEKQRIRDLGIGHRVLNMGYVSDGHLARLYGHALVLVYPSLYEGFGIPLLEAMQCDCPVMASNTSSVPEVVGAAAVLFPPTEDEAMLDVMVAMHDDSALRRTLVERGRVRASLFSWNKTTERTMDVYRRVTGMEVTA